MELKIFNPEKIIFEGEVESASLPTLGGEITVLSGHTALVTPLAEGEVKIVSNEGMKKFLSAGGIFEVSNNKAVMLLRNYRAGA